MTLSTLIFGMCDMKPPFPTQGCLGSCGQMCWRKPMHRINWAHGSVRGPMGYAISAHGLLTGFGAITVTGWAIDPNTCGYRNGEKANVPYRMWEAMKVAR